MKKLMLMATFLFAIFTMEGKEKVPEYAAANGITYKVGDAIKLGKGSAEKGHFLYLTQGGWQNAAVNYGAKAYCGEGFNGLSGTIKKIKLSETPEEPVVLILKFKGASTTYNLEIEKAIEAKEVAE